ncbi:SIMPL domain-containing protein [Aquisalibacillus elongatus]|uniref:Secreted protein n=1 Tax=Aquisalibacillus elongatus TaxID=485577 RepID=A0A3N5BU61_9BACI|nr:SIMPL domain-containing protein [Aquisalibacillus elongatus]RPF53318.1 hypothetical protein EDC24_1815 [Aquisalibacillus elongatus]
MSERERTMTVMGEGIVTTEPNVAEVKLGVVTENQDLTQAQRENAENINRVIRAIMQQGVARQEIQTMDYSIQPQYDYVDGIQQFRGYEVSHFLSVTIDDISNVGRVIDAAVEAGANRVMDIRFSVSHPEVFYQLGLTRALDDAVAKAETLAESMGVEFDPVPLKIEEKFTEGPSPYQTFALTEASSGTQIEPGQLDVSVRIEAKFQYGN